MNHKNLNDGERKIAAWKDNAERFYREGLYNPAHEHDACGVGMVVSTDGKRRREVVEAGIAALKALWHRGAVPGHRDERAFLSDASGERLQSSSAPLDKHAGALRARDHRHGAIEGRLHGVYRAGRLYWVRDG